MSSGNGSQRIDRARSYVAKMDAAIDKSGGDRQTFVVACKLVEFGLTQAEASTVFQEYNSRCQPPWGEVGLARKLRSAFARCAPDSKFDEKAISTTNGHRRKWPKLNDALQTRIIQQEAMGLSDLLERSPCSPEGLKTPALLDQLFPLNPLICGGKSSHVFWTRRLYDFGDMVSDLQLIVPSPMSKLLGNIQDPEPGGAKQSAHTKDNTGSRRFAVVEFDHGSTDDHAALIWHLTQFAPLTMAVHSGGKSLHGWFFVDGRSEELVYRFYRYAVAIGADRATYLKSQFVRMPEGVRDNGKPQKVYYFNPDMIDPPA